MMTHIDVSTVLRQTVACELYSNLVTRSTGAAVRGQIEHLLDEARARGAALTVIDFSQVAMIDFSCADEVVAKLLMRYAADDAPGDAYFLFRGVTDAHWDAIEAVLERHELALALEENGGVRLMGVCSDAERRAWDVTFRLGSADAVTLARELNVDAADAEATLEGLFRRRLVMAADDRGCYMAVGSVRG
jgi:hypothetical protein